MVASITEVEYDRLIKSKEDEVRALKAARPVLFGGKSTTYVKPPVESSDNDSNVASIDWDALGVSMPSHGPTVEERVKAVLGLVPADQEFTVPHVEALLEKTGFSLPGKSPRARLAMIMAKIEKEGLVTRTSKPKGGKAHTFKVVNQEILKAVRNFHGSK